MSAEPNSSDSVRYLKMSCPHCSNDIEFPEHGLGQEVACPHCNKNIPLLQDARPSKLEYSSCSSNKTPPQMPAGIITVLDYVGWTMLLLLGIELHILFSGDGVFFCDWSRTDLLRVGAFAWQFSYALPGIALSLFLIAIFPKAKQCKYLLRHAAWAVLVGAGIRLAINATGFPDSLLPSSEKAHDAVTLEKSVTPQKAPPANGAVTGDFWRDDPVVKTAPPASGSIFVQATRKAAEQGDVGALVSLGGMYLDGEGVEKNEAEAEKCYRKAAEQGDANAMSTLGLLYYYGQGVGKDYAEAVKWFRKAADKNDHMAQNMLGEHYLLGQGVAKDYVEAYAYFNQAATKLRFAAVRRDDLERKMSAQQIAAAQLRTKELEKRTKKPY